MSVELISDNERRVSIEELDTSSILKHAREQAVRRNLDDMLIVDVDSHHYESEHYGEFLKYMKDPVLRQLVGGGASRPRHSVVPSQIGYQDMGGRLTRYPLRRKEKHTAGKVRDVEIGLRWMDAMSVDYACLFPTSMLNVGLHPQTDVEVDLCWAYNRWLTEVVLPESNGRMFSMVGLPFTDPEASLQQVEEFGDRPGVRGFMITTVRTLPVHHNAYMKLYAALEERGLAIAFHSGPNWSEPVFKSCNRFVSVHALSFPLYNMLHMTNWVINGMCERFPKLKVIWIESGLCWLPFMTQRLDHEYMLRSSECPLLKRKPSEYIQDMFYTTQPMEVQNLKALECTFEIINAETQLMFASDYPHWDFDLPGVVHDLPFLTEKARHNILGGNAARLFGLKPRTKAQEDNLKRFGNLPA
jgi:predicted TIM-barrel fold metal-dependent hydrolase